MKKTLLVLLFVFSLFADNSDKRSHAINTENIKRIDITKGVDSSAWQHYQDSNYSIRDKVLTNYNITPDKGFLNFRFSYKLSTLDDKKAKELHTQAYYITHIAVSTDKRVLLNVSMTDLYKRPGGIISLRLSNDQNEKTLTIKITDSNNYTTEYYANISCYTGSQIGDPLELGRLKNKDITDHRRQYPQAWEASDIVSAVEALYGKDMAKKVQEHYRNMDQKSFQCTTDGGVGASVDTNINEKLSSLAVFSNTTNKKALVSIIDVLDLNVSVLGFASIIRIPVRQNGEIMVVGKDREGVLHMSQLMHCNAVNSAEEVTKLIFKLD